MARLFGGALHKHIRTGQGVKRYDRKKVGIQDIVDTISLEKEFQLYQYLNGKISPKSIVKNKDNIIIEYLNGKALSKKGIIDKKVINILAYIHSVKITNTIKKEVLKTDDNLKRINNYKTILLQNKMLYPCIKQAIEWLNQKY